MVMIIREDSWDEGATLLFPGVSSCTAVVADLANIQVGAHCTRDPWQGQNPAAHTQATLDGLAQLINARHVDRLLIVGYNQHHNPIKIKQYLCAALNQAPPSEAYDVDRKDLQALSLIFTHTGGGNRPTVQFKRDSKVASNPQSPWIKSRGRTGTMQINKPHTLRKHFVNI